MFTGSTEVAKLIAAALAGRLRPDGAPIPLIAETGGQNAMIVDSSALPEQVVADALASAFDSAGQRCSALARAVPAGRRRRPHARDAEGGDGRTRRSARPTASPPTSGRSSAPKRATRSSPMSRRCARAASRSPRRRSASACARGFFVAPTLIEINSVADLGREVFGPVAARAALQARGAAGADRRAQRHRLRR